MGARRVSGTIKGGPRVVGDRILDEIADTAGDDTELELDDATLSERIAALYRCAHPDAFLTHSFPKAAAPVGRAHQAPGLDGPPPGKVLILVEARDSAGMGEVLKLIAHRLNLRVVRTVALPASSDRERAAWYFQRSVAHLHAAGEIVLFDRSR
jgi:hypothetical protein